MYYLNKINYLFTFFLIAFVSWLGLAEYILFCGCAEIRVVSL